MGLDCTAYSNVKPLNYDPARHTDEGYDTEGETWIQAFAYAGFHRSTRGLVDHDRESRLYDTDMIAVHDYDITDSKTFRWRAGSYRGYGQFRRSLAQMIGIDYQALRADPDKYQDEPFFELIWFADNEGCIGCESAADLLADFRIHRDQYAQLHPASNDDWYLESYDAWIEALELAADNGLVSFG